MEGSSSDRCTERRALATELAQVLDTVRQLEAHMGLQGGAAGGERCRELVYSMRSSIDRSMHIARSCCVEGRLPGGAESPPSAGDGSPRSAGSDQAGDSRCRGNAAGQCKKRKTLPKWSTQVRVSSVQDVGPLDDGFCWRKYGQKDILGAKYPRAYFRCTHRHTQSCHAGKQVQRTDGDPLLFDVVYHGNHTCAQSTHPNSRRPRPAASAEHPQPQPGQEQSSIPVGFEAEGAVQGLEPVLLQFSFPSKPAGADTGGGGGASSSGFLGCVTASPFVSPATSECQVSGSGYAAAGGSLAGIRNVPDVELTSTTNSAMGDMDFMLQLDADFLDNPGYF